MFEPDFPLRTARLDLRPYEPADLVHLKATHTREDVRFIVHPDFQGRGYATEMGAEMLRIGFGALGLHRVIGRCDGRNTASAKVMERLGMRREAHLLQNEWVKGEWCDELDYAMLEDEWRARA